jgi:hypothetical protein
LLSSCHSRRKSASSVAFALAFAFAFAFVFLAVIPSEARNLLLARAASARSPHERQQSGTPSL